MFEKYGILTTFSIILFWLAVASGIFYLVGVCLKFDRDRLAAIRDIMKTFVGAGLLFFIVAWLTR